MPEESTLPQAAAAQAAPGIAQVTDGFGLPLEFTAAVNGWSAPNSTDALSGFRETDTSLMTVTAAVEFLVGSATLVAWIRTAAGDGRFVGAV